MSSSQVVGAERGKRRVPVALLALALGLWTVVLCWAGVRGFWWWRFGVGVTQKPDVEAVWRLHYEEMYSTGAVDAHLASDDGSYDVLLMGGSVLEQIAPTLEQSLRKELDGRFRLFNLARSAHTSRDTYFKQRRLADQQFDLVIYYDGINDCRMNCCPDDVYRDDYRHFSWYDAVETRLEAGTLSVSDILASRLNRGILTFDIAENRQFSNRIKTPKAYRQNLEPLADAVDRGAGRLLLMTFAYRLPKNYTDEAFRAHQLGYGRGKFELGTDVWGTAEGIEAAITAHNRVLAEIAKQHKNAIFLDEEKQMPKSGTYFSDPCHLTEEGIAKLAEHTMAAVHNDIERWKSEQHLVVTSGK
ncbi:MAG TPA: hypothetical protein VFG04_25700 [Planctomycetaceae bacterium]|nr:hypothetical protein [Planctomycetaceae bacterium]